MFILFVIFSIYLFASFDYSGVMERDMVKVRKWLYFWKKSEPVPLEGYSDQKTKKVDKQTAILREMDMEYRKNEE